MRLRRIWRMIGGQITMSAVRKVVRTIGALNSDLEHRSAYDGVALLLKNQEQLQPHKHTTPQTTARQTCRSVNMHGSKQHIHSAIVSI